MSEPGTGGGAGVAGVRGVAGLASLRPISYGTGVPERPRDHITTDELLAVTGSTRDTLYQWVAQKLLPRPWLTAGTDDRQLVAAWAPETLERVRFIVAQQRKGLAADEIAARVEERWPRRRPS